MPRAGCSPIWPSRWLTGRTRSVGSRCWVTGRTCSGRSRRCRHLAGAGPDRRQPSAGGAYGPRAGAGGGLGGWCRPGPGPAVVSGFRCHDHDRAQWQIALVGSAGPACWYVISQSLAYTLCHDFVYRLCRGFGYRLWSWTVGSCRSHSLPRSAARSSLSTPLSLVRRR